MPCGHSGRICYRFQSTHPVRGATATRANESATAAISIHAPREGCDVVAVEQLRRDLRFQSTHPVRGATISVS